MFKKKYLFFAASILSALTTNAFANDSISQSRVLNQSVEGANSGNSIINVGYDNIKDSFLIEMTTNTGKPLSFSDFKSLDDGSFVTVNWMNTKLDKIHEEVLIMGEKQVFSIPNTNHKKPTKPSCEAMYLTYHLIGDPFPTIKSLLFNKNGTPVASLDDEKCPKSTKIVKDLMDKTASGYIGGFSWTKPVLSTSKPVGFTTTFYDLGQNNTPERVKSYAVNDKFTKFIHLYERPVVGSEFLGKKFENHIKTPGLYYFVMEFTIDGKDEQLSARNPVVGK